FAAIERHALGVLAEANEAEAEIGFVTLLLEVQPDEWPADTIREPGPGAGVEKRRPHHVAGHGEGDAPDSNAERSRQPPENRHERPHRDRRPRAGSTSTEKAGLETSNATGAP